LSNGREQLSNEAFDGPPGNREIDALALLSASIPSSEPGFDRRTIRIGKTDGLPPAIVLQRQPHTGIMALLGETEVGILLWRGVGRKSRA
jgi:hypothetical protein